MSKNFLINKCTLNPTEGSSLKEPLDLCGGNPNITYHESILSPSIALTVQSFSIDSVISERGINGGEQFEIEVKIQDDSGLDDFKIGLDHKLTVNGVNVTQGPKGELSILEAVSSEVMVNETARISKRYSDSIDKIVTEILTEDPKGIQTSKELDSDESGNKYSFVGNYRKPFELIQWLQPKATKDLKSIFGFLFWENLDGYHFKSIDTLFEESADEPYPQIQLPYESFRKIIEADAVPNSDIVMNLTRGMYANKTIYVDLISGEKTVIDFSIQDMDLERPPKLPEGLELQPSRLMFRITDQGALQEGPELEKVEKAQDLASYQNKSYARNNLIFSQSVSASIPFNPNLRAGKTIEVQFPINPDETKEPDKLGDEGDNSPSGKYLIAELKHVIGNGDANTQLSLIRNVFTAEGA